MKPTINLNRESDLIQIFIPAHLGRHSGKRIILSPTGQPVNSDRNEEADGHLVQCSDQSPPMEPLVKQRQI